MERKQLQAIVEALIFVSEEPMTLGSLALVLGEAGVEKSAIRQVVDDLQIAYSEDASRGLDLRDIAGGYQFRSKADLAPWIQRLNVPKPTRLSPAAMETLSIVAYRQPLVRAEIEDIRGVDCGGVLKTLLERNLIRILGKREEPGSPLLYGTTSDFLSHFNLEKLGDLPPLKEYQELDLPLAHTMVDAEGAGESVEDNVPIAPIDAEQQVAMEKADQTAIDELEEQIRSLRHLERTVFPKQEERFILEEHSAEASTVTAESPMAQKQELSES